MASDGESGFHLWPLARVDVEGLFGRKKGFSLELDPRLTVLTGENGSGKSTLLKAIHLVGMEEWSELFAQPLSGLNLAFADGPELVVRWATSELTVSDGSEQWSFDAESALQFGPGVLRDFRRTRNAGAHERAVHFAGKWRTDLLLSASGPEELERLIAPDWLSAHADHFQTKLISARRLEHRLRPDAADGEEARVPVVEEFATRLRDMMKNHLSAYAADSRRQEKILPTKIVEAMQQQGPAADPEALADEVANLRSEVRRLADSLASVGLFEEEEADHLGEYPRDKTPILLAVREVYRVTKNRLEQLTPLRTDLELFSSFLNERFSNKRVVLDQSVGIAVKLDSGEVIGPSDLSSGEQQLLALAFELLFESSPEMVVLLDEPELSLHVAWLQGLLGAFNEIGDSRGLQFLIATHSPSVLRGHQERERSLDVAGLS